MDRRKLVTLTNLCMITKGDEILVIDRQKKDWPGFTFPGGHVEDDESIVDSVIREVKEETGLNIQNPKLCGVKDWVNSDGSRYIVFLYICNTFTGDIISSNEGKVSWVKREDFLKLKLSVDMDVLIRVFEDPEITEFYYQKVNEEWNIYLK
ncbi:MAG: 8-oxo-dGTP diphosphatase [Solobacterium sp.]|nr:8-oxo-dGTP diphosphatase [Solobacterium sp.]MBF1113838.1 8-oxo-dGTP diphosphatase [Solobacterium sp.]